MSDLKYFICELLFSKAFGFICAGFFLSMFGGVFCFAFIHDKEDPSDG